MPIDLTRPETLHSETVLYPWQDAIKRTLPKTTSYISGAPCGNLNPRSTKSRIHIRCIIRQESKVWARKTEVRARIQLLYILKHQQKIQSKEETVDRNRQTVDMAGCARYA